MSKQQQKYSNIKSEQTQFSSHFMRRVECETKSNVFNDVKSVAQQVYADLLNSSHPCSSETNRFGGNWFVSSIKSTFRLWCIIHILSLERSGLTDSQLISKITAQFHFWRNFCATKVKQWKILKWVSYFDYLVKILVISYENKLRFEWWNRLHSAKRAKKVIV